MKGVLFTFFKTLRKTKYAFQDKSFELKKKYYYYISKQRFSIKPTVKGKRFSINSDLSETTLLINDYTNLRDNFNIRLRTKGRVIIGKNCFFNNNCSVNCFELVEIGDNNQFGENVMIYDHNHRFSDKSVLISQQGYTTEKITIGDNCWIGSNVTILKGVSIGNNVVIGAGCIIFKSIESDSVVTNHQDLVIKSR